MNAKGICHLFPINSPTLFSLTLVAVVMCAAMAVRFRSFWRLLFTALLAALPLLFIRQMPSGTQYDGLGYVIVVAASLLAAGAGAGWGAILRLLGVPAVVSAIVVCGLAALVAGSMLWGQYVPNSCDGKPLLVNVAGQKLSIPSEMRPLVWPEEKQKYWANPERKREHSYLCGISENASRVISVNEIKINPVAVHKSLSAVCMASDPPSWCSNYSNHFMPLLVEFSVSSPADPGKPAYYWNWDSPDVFRQGDVREGFSCLWDAETKLVRECSIWQPFGTGFRLTVETTNRPGDFESLSIDEVREGMIAARSSLLSSIQN